MSEFLTFQRFNDKALAEELILLLEEKNIEYEAINYASAFDTTFTNNDLSKEVSVKLRKEDFDEVHDLLIKKAAADVDKIPEDYHLFEFSDEELIEIVSKPDEWSHFDYILSLKILKKRGKEVNADLARVLRKNRVSELSKTETGVKIWIVLGYLLALLGGPIGVFMGIHIATHKKILPNGDSVYSFEETDRKHGIAIFLIGIVCVVFWLAINILSEI